MPKWLVDIGAILVAIFASVLVVEEPGNGATKKAWVMERVGSIIDQPGGIDWPPWLTPHKVVILGFFVELMLWAAKKGFFDKLKLPSPQP